MPFSTYLQVDDTVGVFNDSRRIRCEEIFDFLVLERLELRSAFSAWNQRHFPGSMWTMFCVRHNSKPSAMSHRKI